MVILDFVFRTTKKNQHQNFSSICRKTFRWPFDSLQHYAFPKAFRNMVGNVSNSFLMKKYNFEHPLHPLFKLACSKNM
eukprot:UN06363